MKNIARACVFVCAGPIIIVMVCFPPLRRAGIWRDVATGAPISASSAIEFDRAYFGYLPHYDWIGVVEGKQDLSPGGVVTLGDDGPNQCVDFVWKVDWWFVAAEVAILLTALLLPFVRDRPQRNGD